MEKRLGSLKKDIDSAKLKINDELKEIYENSENKLDYILKWMKGDDENLKLFAIYNLRNITEDYVPEEDTDFELDEDFKNEILLSMFDTDKRTSSFTAWKLEISNVLINLTYKSDDFTQYLSDYDYICRFCNLTYEFAYSADITENIIIILGNIFASQYIDLNEFVTNVPFAIRMREIYQRFIDNANLRYHIYWVVSVILDRLKLHNFGTVLYINIVRMFS